MLIYDEDGYLYVLMMELLVSSEFVRLMKSGRCRGTSTYLPSRLPHVTMPKHKTGNSQSTCFLSS